MTGAESTAAAPVPLLNAANVLTGARLMLVPVFAATVIASGMSHAGWQMAACLIFAVASATDLVDGWIARRYELVTSLGKVADPIADKALTGTALVLLSLYDRLPWWVTVVIMSREIGITLLRLWVIRYGVIPASRGGKLKTALLIAATGFAFALGDIDSVFGWLTVGLALLTLAGLGRLLRRGSLRAVLPGQGGLRGLIDRGRPALRAGAHLLGSCLGPHEPGDDQQDDAEA